MGKPVVAIVGRPNVGKSTLLNRLCGRRLAIVEDRPGITRDRLEQEVEWRGHRFLLVDTGGLTYRDDTLGEKVRGQAQDAIQKADLVLFMVDGRQGITAEDEEVASLLHKTDRPVLLVVNKVENQALEAVADEFFQLGLGEPFPISALHGRNTGDLLDRVLDYLGEIPPAEERDVVRVAVIGRPNVGKSSLINRLLGEDRVIVSDLPGTTRDAIDVEITYEGQNYLLIDTAGIRRRARVDSAVEYYSVKRALEAIERAQVVLMVLEGPAGITAQDKRLAARVAAARKAMVLVVNKWDLVDKVARENFPALLAQELAYVSWAPHIFVSALTGRRVVDVLARAREVYNASGRRIGTGELNRFLAEVIALTPPPQRARRPLRFYYATQVGIYPPAFVLFVSQAESWPVAYLRHLENRLRESYDFEGTPLRLLVREAGQKGGGG